MAKTITVATDGSARNNPTGPAGWAWYVDSDSWSCGGFEQASNNYAELCAVMAALKQIPEHYPLHILTDSQYITKMFGENGKGGYVQGWRKNNWLKQDGNPPANMQVVKTILALIVRRTSGFKITWVRGHNGHSLNTKADTLCTKMSELIQKKKNLPPSPGWNDTSGMVAQRASTNENDAGIPIAQKKAKPAPKKTSKNDYIKGSPKPRLRKREIYTAALPEWDDEDAADAEYNVRRKQERQKEKMREGKTVLCPSCDTPINPLTFECKCSM